MKRKIKNHQTAEMSNRKPKTKPKSALLLIVIIYTHTLQDPNTTSSENLLEQSWKDRQKGRGLGHSPSHLYRLNGLGCQTSQRWRWERGGPQSTGGWGGWLSLEVRRYCILGLEGKGRVLKVVKGKEQDDTDTTHWFCCTPILYYFLSAEFLMLYISY